MCVKVRSNWEQVTMVWMKSKLSLYQHWVKVVASPTIVYYVDKNSVLTQVDIN